MLSRARTISSGRPGLWSLVRGTACPLRHSTARESPAAGRQQQKKRKAASARGMFHVWERALLRGRGVVSTRHACER